VKTLRPKGDDQAPELDSAVAWLNVDRPITMGELRGSVVVLDFWTYCCINCMHVLPTLREIEHRHLDDPLVVIGVHSGKFNAERDPDRIREAIGRYGVEHPVAVDDDMAIWSRYGIRSWPSIVVVRPDGTIAAVAPGEPELEVLDAFIQRELDAARAQGILASEPPNIDVAPLIDSTPLQYPGKIDLLPDGRLAISDSGHHRVMVCERDGAVVLTAGGGLRGWADGPAEQAAFDDPQGLCWHGEALYVADTRNHAIRRVDLGSGEVTTVAGTTELGVKPPAGKAVATEVALRSPWDLCPVGDVIYVAMAGSHQIWRFWPEDGQIEVYAGTGIEALIDGDVARSAWAQPSGLSEREGILYVADSETSALRAIDLEQNTVRTLAGQGLFDFGDGEGEADGPLLQHCLGVEATADGVFIADTYNGKIKLWTPKEGSEFGAIATVFEGLKEPASVVVAEDGALLVADTNAHRIVEIVDGKLRVIEVQGAPQSQRGPLVGVSVHEPPPAPVEGWFTTLLKLPEGAGLKEGDGGVLLNLHTPKGTELVEGSPIHVSSEVSRRSDLLLVERPEFSLEARGGPSQIIHVEVRVLSPPEPRIEAELVTTIHYVACQAGDHACCTPGRLLVRVPVRLVSFGGKRQLEFGIELGGVPD
jgi:thiol-disulfide isomerase/thioredoxin